MPILIWPMTSLMTLAMSKSQTSPTKAFYAFMEDLNNDGQYTMTVKESPAELKPVSPWQVLKLAREIEKKNNFLFVI